MNVLRSHIKLILIVLIALELVGITVLTAGKKQQVRSEAEFDPAVALEFVDNQGYPLPKTGKFTYETASDKVYIRLKSQ